MTTENWAAGLTRDNDYGQTSFTSNYDFIIGTHVALIEHGFFVSKICDHNIWAAGLGLR